jgi:hypothetical protein
MRATLWAATLSLTMAVLATGCESRPPAAAEGHDIVRPALGFAINVPKGWTFRDLDGDVVLELYPPGAETPAAADAKADEAPKARPSRSSPVVQVTVIGHSGLSLDAWADEAAAQLKELQANIEVVGRRPEKLADGHDALRVDLRNARGVRPEIQQMLLVITGHRAYAVIATAPEPDLAAAEPAFRQCFSSLVVW